MEENCPNGHTGSAVMVEIQGVYDGGLFWHCDECEISWHRWADEHMRSRAQPFIDKWNERFGHGKQEGR